jgi:hypothetical protein
MAFIKKKFLLLKIFEKVEKTGIISTKFSFRCTPSVILGSWSHLLFPTEFSRNTGILLVVMVLFFKCDELASHF